MANELKITVMNLAATGWPRPVTGGVPLSQGTAPKDAVFRLTQDSQEVLCQSEILGTWPDGSVRWLLLDFQADPPPKSSNSYKLVWGTEPPRITPEAPVEAAGAERFYVNSGNIDIRPADNALFNLSARFNICLTALDSEGTRCSAKVESATVQTAGPMRSTLCLAGSLRSDAGKRLMGYRCWISVFAGLSRIMLEPMLLVDADKGIIQIIKELTLEIVPAHKLESAAIGGLPGWRGKPDEDVRLFQVDDRQYRFEGAPGAGAKAPGWAEIKGPDLNLAVAVRDFWQQWPKSLEVCRGLLKVGLFPKFRAGDFDHMLDPWYKHDYLFEGDCYRLRTGQTRRWQVWIDIEGGGPSLAECANYPLFPATDPAHALATGLWGNVKPSGAPGMGDYDAWAENLFNAYFKSIETERDYGAMNWGDWFGERGCNWGNLEYDTPCQFFVQFARTGDPKYLYMGQVAARHMSEVDVVHFINDDLKTYFETKTLFREGCFTEPGLVHQHAVGHVGGFHSVQVIHDLYLRLRVGNTDKPYLCLDPYNLGHIFTQGMMYCWFLTGDAWMKETLGKIGDHLARLVEERKFKFKGNSHCGRENGWTSLALAACYEVDHNPRYLNAMKTLADDALEEQDPNCGGWLYTLDPGHCDCVTKKHVGEAAFISSVRVNGLYRYYRLSHDARIPEAIKRSVTHTNHDTWNELQSGWRYTSCPETYSSVSQHGMILQAVANSVSLCGDEEHLRILKKAWNALFEKLKASAGTGQVNAKAFSLTIYGCPEVASLLADSPNAFDEPNSAS